MGNAFANGRSVVYGCEYTGADQAQSLPTNKATGSHRITFEKMAEQRKYAIHEAARENKVLTVQSLLQENPKLAISTDEDMRTPLHWACTMNNERIIDILLPHVTVDLDDLVDASGWTPVHIMAALGNIKYVGKLMDIAPQPTIDFPTSTGATCLHLAVSKNHYDLVADLIDVYKCSVRAKDRKGYTALHRAAAIGSQPLIKMLVEAKASINGADSDGWTALHHALAEGHGDAGALLVLLGADANAENSAGEVPVQVASDDSVRKFFADAIRGD